MKKFTVISFDESTGQSVCDHVEANNGIHAFMIVAQKRPSFTMVVSIPGHLTEGAGEVEFPGDGIVDAGTILSQPDVFGAAEDTQPLSKEDLLSLGYEIAEDPDQPGMFYWRYDQVNSDVSYISEAFAITVAEADAKRRFEIYRCDNCGKAHSAQTLQTIKDLTMRVDVGGIYPAGECKDCGALCYGED